MLASWLSLPFLPILLGSPATSGSPQGVPSEAERSSGGSEDSAALFVRGERVLVAPGIELENAAIVIERGVIVAVGTDLEPPEGARRLEGAVVCAGFLDPWSSLGLDPGSSEDMGTSPSTRSLDALDPYRAPHLRGEALAAGVTSLRLQAGHEAPVGGLGAVVRTWADGEPVVLLEDACMAATVGIDRGGQRADVFRRMGEVGRLTSLLAKGASYREDQVEYRHELAEWEAAIAEKTKELEDEFKKAKKKRDKDVEKAAEKGEEHKDKRYKEDKKPRAPREDADQAALARVAEGELPLVVEVHGTPELRELLETTERFGRLRLVVAGATAALPLADELAERGIPVLLWGHPEDPAAGLDVPGTAGGHLALAAEFHRRGVEVLLGSGGERHARDLRLLAALAVSAGLPPSAALHAITSGPARAFDLDRRVGRLERGLEADVLIFDGDPLDTRSTLQAVVSGGRVVVE